MRLGCIHRNGDYKNKSHHCKFRMALKLLITDDPQHEKYYEIENWEVIPVEKRASHTCYKDAALGTNFWPKLTSVVPGKSDKVEWLSR